MRKKILFPYTNRCHIRQKILLNSLSEYFEIHIATYGEKNASMTEIAEDITSKFTKALDTIQPDLVLIRGDRFELLPVAMLTTYSGIKMAQIEAGDLSGVIDNKVRYAISHLADYHFATNEEAKNRLLGMGFKNVWNTGSLDIEYADMIARLQDGQGNKKELEIGKYIVVLFHEIPGEDLSTVMEAVHKFPYSTVLVKGNSDYTKFGYSAEEFEPDEFIRILKGASCLVGNSSAGIKEASILRVRVVNVGSRQANRLKPKNVMDCPCEVEEIVKTITKQLENTYTPDLTYFKEDTSKNITKIIKTIVT